MKIEDLHNFQSLLLIVLTYLSIDIDTLPCLIVGGGELFCNFGDFCALLSLNYDPPFKNIFGKIQAPLLIITSLFTFNFHEICISERKTIKTKLLTQKQSKKLFSVKMWT